MSFFKKFSREINKGAKVVSREINRMVEHSEKAGQKKESIINTKNIGGEILEFEQKEIANFTTIL